MLIQGLILLINLKNMINFDTQEINIISTRE